MGRKGLAQDLAVVGVRHQQLTKALTMIPGLRINGVFANWVPV